MMVWHALLLGLVQGVTEFFPVSSSAHLLLLEHLLGSSTEIPLLFPLSCHLGTLFVLIVYWRRELLFWRPPLWSSPSAPRHSLLTLWVLALLPLPMAYLLLRNASAAMGHSAYGWCWLVTAILLILSEIIPKRSPEQLRHSLWIGCAQSLALLPGISRSAATISCARILGWEQSDAVRFSFLLAIPTVLGGCALEVLQLLRADTSVELSSMWRPCAVGFFSAACIGALVIRGAMRYLKEKSLFPYALYCAGMGLVVLIMD